MRCERQKIPNVRGEARAEPVNRFETPGLKKLVYMRGGYIRRDDLLRWVDPGGSRQRRGHWCDALEALRVGEKGVVERLYSVLVESRGGAVMNRVRGHEPDATVTMHGVVSVKELLAVPASILDRPEALAGKSGRYFKVLNCASEKGLSSETCGRL